MKATPTTPPSPDQAIRLRTYLSGAASLVAILAAGVLLAALVEWGIEASPSRTPPEQRALPTASRSADTRGGDYRVSWTPRGGVVPLNDYFDVKLIVEKNRGDLGPLEGGSLSFRALMPEHGHGMNVRPRVRELGEGRYSVEGVLLHMGGRWVMEVDVAVEDGVERAAFEINL